MLRDEWGSFGAQVVAARKGSTSGGVIVERRVRLAVAYAFQDVQLMRGAQPRKHQGANVRLARLRDKEMSNALVAAYFHAGFGRAGASVTMLQVIGRAIFVAELPFATAAA